MNNLDYSVVIPAYNAAQYLEETLRSILNQRCKPREVIVCNDGSVDGTQEIAENFNKLVTCITKENGGQGHARKVAIEHATGEWIALCDSDDIWREDHIDRRIQLLRHFQDADFTFSNFCSFGPAAKDGHTLLSDSPSGWLERWSDKSEGEFVTLKDPYAALLEFNPAYVSGLVFKRESYHRMGGFDEKYSRWIAEDSEFTRRFAALNGVNVAGDLAVTWMYRRHASNYSAQQWKNVRARARVLEEHLQNGITPVHLRDSTKMAMQHALGSAFDIAFWDKAYKDAENLFKELPINELTMKRIARFVQSKIASRVSGTS